MATTITKATEEAKIRELIDDWAAAARASDIDGIMSHYAPDIVAFDAIARLQFKGKDAYRKHWEACLSMCGGPMIFEVHDLQIAARDDLAFGHYLSRCAGPGRTVWKRPAGCAGPSAAAS
jgi:ketosteroid isomerase-like protein